MQTTLTRRAALAATLATAFGPLPSALAQPGGYPARPVKVIVPFVPGGNADSTARIFAEAYGQRLGQPFVIDNRGGAGGMIGTSQMVRSEPDGYTLLMGTTGPIVSSWQMAGKAATYGLKDMKPVALLTLVPGVLVVNAGSALKTWQDFAAHARARPGELRIGHPGNGTAGHVNILQMQKALGTQFVIVGYKGAGPAVQDLLGNQIDAVATDLPSALQLVKGSKLRALACRPWPRPGSPRWTSPPSPPSWRRAPCPRPWWTSSSRPTTPCWPTPPRASAWKTSAACPRAWRRRISRSSWPARPRPTQRSSSRGC
jgi:tripartite-type tricarboxylate transporter receptor subunit TctC